MRSPNNPSANDEMSVFIGGRGSESYSGSDNGEDEFDDPILSNPCEKCGPSIEGINQSNNIWHKIIELGKQVVEKYNAAANKMTTLSAAIQEMERKLDALARIVEAINNTLEG